MNTPEPRVAAPSSAWDQLRSRTLSVAAVRDIDRRAIDDFNMHSLVLMENAALSCVRWLTERFANALPNARMRVVLLCGRGNNGGDGLAMARHLRLIGWQCTVLVAGPVHALSPDARANWQILTARSHKDCYVLNDPSTSGVGKNTASTCDWPKLLADADLIIDAMVGSGASGPPRPPFDQWIRVANSANGSRVAIDIPTGIDGETGAVSENAFRASATLTFVARKPGLNQPEAQTHVGEVAVMSIGIPVEMIEELLVDCASDC